MPDQRAESGASGLGPNATGDAICHVCGMYGWHACPGPMRQVPMEPIDRLRALNQLGVWQMQQRPIDRLARELSMAIVAWLASDTDDDLFDEVNRLAKKWKEAVIDGD